jgi:isoleucyl-tRNA synthetase
LELKALAVLKQPARELSPQQIRAAARAEAERGIKLQRDEFREFGLLGEWDEGTGYRTMSWAYEKRQLGVVREMVRKGAFATTRELKTILTEQIHQVS